MIAYVTGMAEPACGRDAYSAAMQLFRIFSGVHVSTPYPMKHARSAAVVVLAAQQGNRPVGVITEADIARAVADGMDVNTTRIHLLTARPAAIPAATSIRNAATTMVHGGFRQVPVTEAPAGSGSPTLPTSPTSAARSSARLLRDRPGRS